MFVKGSLLNNNCHVTNHQEQMLRVCTRETSDKERGITVSVVKFITFTAQHYISTLHYKLRVVRHLWPGADTRQSGQWPGGRGRLRRGEQNPFCRMFAELELEYLVKSRPGNIGLEVWGRPGNMGLEVWGRGAQHVTRRTVGVIAGSLATVGLLYLFFRDKVSSSRMFYWL